MQIIGIPVICICFFCRLFLRIKEDIIGITQVSGKRSKTGNGAKRETEQNGKRSKTGNGAKRKTGQNGKQSKAEKVLGTGDTCGLTITTNAGDPDLCAKVAAIYAYSRQIAEYQIQNAVTVAMKTDGIETNEPLCAASEQLLEMMPKLSYGSTFLHVVPNTEFAASFTEEMQKLLVGESTEEFIGNVDKMIEDTTK